MDGPDFKIGEAIDDLNQNEDSKHLLSVSRDDYESLPKHMKGLVSWEDLLVAVEKMNSCIATNKIKADTFRQDGIELLELGMYTTTLTIFWLDLSAMRLLCIWFHLLQGLRR